MPFCIFRKIWRLAQSDMFRFVKVGWVLVMKVPFLFWSEEMGLTTPTPGAACIPRRWRPQPPAHPDRLHSTGSRADHAKTRAGKYQDRPCKAQRTGAHARTPDTLHLSAPDTRQGAAGRSGRCRGLDCMQSLYHAYYDSSITGMVY